MVLSREHARWQRRRMSAYAARNADVDLDALRRRRRGGPILAGFALIPDTEVLIVSGRAGMDDAVRALRLGVIDLLRKPFGVAEFRPPRDELWPAVARAPRNELAVSADSSATAGNNRHRGRSRAARGTSCRLLAEHLGLSRTESELVAWPECFTISARSACRSIFRGRLTRRRVRAQNDRAARGSARRSLRSPWMSRSLRRSPPPRAMDGRYPDGLKGEEIRWPRTSSWRLRDAMTSDRPAAGAIRCRRCANSFAVRDSVRPDADEGFVELIGWAAARPEQTPASGRPRPTQSPRVAPCFRRGPRRCAPDPRLPERDPPAADRLNGNRACVQRRLRPGRQLECRTEAARARSWPTRASTADLERGGPRESLTRLVNTRPSADQRGAAPAGGDHRDLQVGAGMAAAVPSRSAAAAGHRAQGRWAARGGCVARSPGARATTTTCG